MRVLLTTVSLNARTGGGTAERTKQLAIYLQRQCDSCVVATIEDGDLANELRALGVGVYATGRLHLRFSLPLIAPWKLIPIVRESDAIHILGYWNFLSVTTALLARIYRKKYIFSAAGEFVGLDNPRPIAVAFHKLFGKRMVRQAALIAAITPLEQMQIMKRFQLSADKVPVVPNGVDEAASVSMNTTDASPPFILFVGRLAAVKGPDLLIDAFANIASHNPDVNLVMAGPDFGMLSGLREQVAARGLEKRVTFPGHLNKIEKEAAYRKALFLAVPSRSEAMSLVALEAGVVGTPVLLTDQCGFDVESIGGGTVVAATVSGLETGLQAMLNARSHREEQGALLKAHIDQAYTWPSIVARLRNRFKSLIATD